jgi:hypothetical protein
MPDNKPTEHWKLSYKRAQIAHEKQDYEAARTGYLRALTESSYLPTNSEERIQIKLGLVSTLCGQGDLKLALRVVKDARKAIESDYSEDTYGLAKMERAIVFLMRSHPPKHG